MTEIDLGLLDSTLCGQEKAVMTDKLRISFIVAVAENGVIGRRGGMAWKISTDLKHFRKLTLGKPVVMGRKTFASLGKPLEKRDNIVLTRDPDFRFEGVKIVGDVDEALEVAGGLANCRGACEIMIIGGAEIYRAMMPVADRIYLTLVHGNPEGDTYLPDLNLQNWELQQSEFHRAGERDDFDVSFKIYDRKCKKSDARPYTV